MGRIGQDRFRQIAFTLFLVVAFPLVGATAYLGAAQTATPAAGEECPAGTPAAGAATPTAGAELCVHVELDDIYFEPNLITIPADEAVTFVLTNEGEILHNFSITEHGNDGLENLNIVENVEPGQTKSITITAPEGDYYFFCDQPGHEQAGMRGYLNLQDGAEISTSEATVTPRAG
jgi:uncharacterized cupredoxin-like copper-binding protein